MIEYEQNVQNEKIIIKGIYIYIYDIIKKMSYFDIIKNIPKSAQKLEYNHRIEVTTKLHFENMSSFIEKELALITQSVLNADPRVIQPLLPNHGILQVVILLTIYP